MITIKYYLALNKTNQELIMRAVLTLKSVGRSDGPDPLFVHLSSLYQLPPESVPYVSIICAKYHYKKESCGDKFMAIRESVTFAPKQSGGTIADSIIM